MSKFGSLYLSLTHDLQAPAAWTAGAISAGSYSSTKRATLVASALVESPNNLFARINGAAALAGTFVEEKDFFVETENGGTFALWYRGNLDAGTLVAYGPASVGDFRAKGSSFTIHNPNGAAIYFRVGTPNYTGEAIATPAQVAGDATLSNVVGMSIPAGGFGEFIQGVHFQVGESVHLIGSMASQKAIVHFA